jgi:Ca-activated chloride channel family protein
MAALVLVTCGAVLRRELLNALPRDTPPTASSGAHEPPRSGDPAGSGAGSSAPHADGPVTINIAYGTEKRLWLESALEEFRRTPAGERVRVELYGMGSLEGARAVLDGPGTGTGTGTGAAGRRLFHVWSPASSTYRDLLESEWKARHGGSPILSAEDLALTPMVFVLWKQRHDAFLRKYPGVNFRVLAEAMNEPGGWGGIAGRPEWGLFKFGHADPNTSNSGLQMLVLLGYEFSGKQRGLDVGDVARDEFQRRLRSFERGVTRHGSALTRSTGDLMEEMVLRGPPQYDCLMVYENLAIDYMRAAAERWGEQGELAVAYPDPNIWNDHPYYILDVPWSDEPQRAAASEFLRFLLSAPIQRRALEHGFRPGNPAVPVDTPESPLVRNRKYGFRIDLPTMGEPPTAEVLRALLAAFRRVER